MATLEEKRKKSRTGDIVTPVELYPLATAARIAGGGLLPEVKRQGKYLGEQFEKFKARAKRAFFGPGHEFEVQPADRPPVVPAATPAAATQFLPADTPLQDAHVQTFRDSQATAPEARPMRTAEEEGFGPFIQRPGDGASAEPVAPVAAAPEADPVRARFLGPNNVIQGTPEAIALTKRYAKRQGLTKEARSALDVREEAAAVRAEDMARAEREAQAERTLRATEAEAGRATAENVAGIIAQGGVDQATVTGQYGLQGTQLETQAQVASSIAAAAGGDRVAQQNIQARIQIAQQQGDSRTIEGITSAAIKSMSEEMWITDKETGRSRQATPAEKYAAIKPIMDAATATTQQPAAGANAADLDGNDTVSPDEQRVSQAEAVMKSVKDGQTVSDSVRVQAEAILAQHRDRVKKAADLGGQTV